MFKEDKFSFKGVNSAGRSTFLSYPKHLKMTLFLDDPKLEKIRKLEFMQRYMVIDEIKELGNECYNLGQYDKAIGTYNNAYACLKWLEYNDPEDENDIETAKTTDDSHTLDSSMKKIAELTSEMSEELRSKINVDLASLTEKSFHANKKLTEQKKKDPRMKRIMAVYDDDNTKLMTDENLSCEHDIQMRKAYITLRRQLDICHPAEHGNGLHDEHAL
jgi:Tetratricopeptide repeat